MKYILASAAVIGSVLISGMVDINIEHHLNLPELNKTNITKHTGIFNNKYDIYLTDQIKGMGHYPDVIKTLENAKKGDTVIFHLAGYGGAVDGLINIQSAITFSKANVVMQVEGPVYSGHAYLALTPGTTLIMAPHTFLMLHFSSILNEDCNAEKGIDRGVSNVEHCQVLKNVLINQNIEILSKISILTTEDIISLSQGHDLYLTKEEVEKRQAK